MVLVKGSRQQAEGVGMWEEEAVVASICTHGASLVNTHSWTSTGGALPFSHGSEALVRTWPAHVKQYISTQDFTHSVHLFSKILHWFEGLTDILAQYVL